MSRRIEFITPENIEVSYELAGFGSRFVATVIDILIQGGTLFLLALTASRLGPLSGQLGRAFLGELPVWLAAGLGLVSFAVMVGYHVFFELLWAGQTPGKKLTRLRVVRDGGYSIDAYASLVRNVVRLLDLLPPPYGAGLVSVFVSREYKRLGDIAAGTLVIKDGSVEDLMGRKIVLSPLARLFADEIRNVDALTADDFVTLARFAARRHELDIPVQAHIAVRLATPYLATLGIRSAIPVQWHYADLIDAIVRRYIDDRRLLSSEDEADWLAEPASPAPGPV